ncbi:MAG: hypothetical protein HZB15_00720 [Actinobacteria bacterium]|nr:hypothetical protein [Actinomycetota bacterium]
MPRIAHRPRPFRNRPVRTRQGRTRRASRIASTFADHRCTDELSIIVDRLSE